MIARNTVLVTRACTSRTYNPDGTFSLTIQPHDFQFRKMIEDAGVKVTEHDRDLLDDPGLVPDNIDDAIATVLDPYAKFKETK
jgi:hypothetical protein